MWNQRQRHPTSASHHAVAPGIGTNSRCEVLVGRSAQHQGCWQSRHLQGLSCTTTTASCIRPTPHLRKLGKALDPPRSRRRRLNDPLIEDEKARHGEPHKGTRCLLRQAHEQEGLLLDIWVGHQLFRDALLGCHGGFGACGPAV